MYVSYRECMQKASRCLPTRLACSVSQDLQYPLPFDAAVLVSSSDRWSVFSFFASSRHSALVSQVKGLGTKKETWVLRSHMGVVGIFCARSLSPWRKNSSVTRMAHFLAIGNGFNTVRTHGQSPRQRTTHLVCTLFGIWCICILCVAYF